ncbi:hypothetical protein H1V43_31270 [Streptomyces sp. PSKA54]|uniref:Uncharacterized protein n=1 Tax=Streptomyces himalayensis subsp. aureolus TaxID=2758039 RepID=A0A7W2D6M9_9ACTN|nr:hypothetical protein [Streptomyces himalayensis subsp. aureolus]
MSICCGCSSRSVRRDGYDRRAARAAGLPAAGLPAAGLPAAGFPTAGFSAVGIPAPRIPADGHEDHL